ncbi:sporulation protein YunB [Neobacillus sp. YIM B02564]|uniref:Sporulation protein YunB n=1 Tax=Neobacillus paridis TaxID=2803862 RepID=A0ABS1TU93_9BACI|nr:sporulation protein YunB [Neobacillus paridis]MBL4954863.1 sporulation protein YunB [Neobacillus paridis]
MAKFRKRRLRRGALPFRYVMLLTFVFFLLSTAIGVLLVNKGIEPTLMRYAESETRNIASIVINRAITKRTTNVGENNKVIIVSPGENGTGQNAELNTDLINRVLAETTAQIQKNIRAAKQGRLASLEQLTDVEIETEDAPADNAILWYVPLGRATNIALLGNLGPKIPVKFQAVGEVEPDVKIKTKEMGINNTWIEVSVEIEVSVQFITPFATDITKLQQSIPVGAGMISGPVPQFYNSSGGLIPSVQVPNQTPDNKTEKKKETKKSGN